jgi:hypothetical protein
MSDGDVHSNDMNSPHDFDDAAIEALLGGHGADVDPRLSELLDNMRTAYTSTAPVIGAELAALLTPGGPVAAAPPSALPRRLERMRSSTLARIGAAAAVVVAATGGLAVANALPAPMQDALSHLGIGAPANAGHVSIRVDEATTTTVATTASTTPTTEARDNHGSVVSPVAHDHSDGCSHGADVSQVASGGRTHNGPPNSTSSRPCETTTTTIGSGSTPKTVHHGTGTSHSDHQGNSQPGHDSTPPTTITATTPTTSHQQTGGNHGGRSPTNK